MTVGSIVNTGEDLGIDSLKTFGLFLGFFIISHPVPEDFGRTSRPGDPAADSPGQRKQALSGDADRSLVGKDPGFPSVAGLSESVLPQALPPLGGITNMNLNPLWEQRGKEQEISYLRAVSTGPITRSSSP